MQESYKNILDSLFDGVYLVDRDRRITYWNLGAQRISGFSPEEVMGKRCSDNLLMHVTPSGDELCHSGCPLTQTLLDGQQRETVVFLHHKDGHRLPVVVRISPLRDKNQKIIGAVEAFSDATTHLRIQRELEELKNISLTDQLTGLGNRTRAAREFERRLGELRRYGIHFGLLFVDIDHFKAINDTHGHAMGDRALVTVANTLKHSLRAIDTVCRWGGEEFVVVLPKVDEATFRAIAGRMRRTVETAPIETSVGRLSLTVSVGGAMARPEDSLETLVTRADSMMYRAKEAGRNCLFLDCPQDEPQDEPQDGPAA